MTVIDDVVEDVLTARASLNESGRGGVDDSATPEFTMLPRCTRADMRRRRLRFVCPEARALPRGVISSITALGGVGKTRFTLQFLAELGDGIAPFGEETLRPETRVRSLYVGAEDSEPLFNEIALPLLASDDATLPFDVLLLEEQGAGLTLNAKRAQRLARFAADHGPYDVIVFDPLSALIPQQYADAVRNQFVARKWQRIAFGPFRMACPQAAIVLVAHDTKSGAAMSGSADFINFGRCVLQLRAGGIEGGPDDVPEGSIEVLRVKDNVGFRYKRMIFCRDPHTLLLTVTKTEAAYGAAARPTRMTQADIEQYLATQALRFLKPALVPDEERTRTRVEAILVSRCARDGLKVSARNIDRFLDGFCTWRKERHGRSDVKILDAVRDPSAEEEARYGA